MGRDGVIQLTMSDVIRRADLKRKRLLFAGAIRASLLQARGAARKNRINVN